MSTLQALFEKMGVALYQNESFNLDVYYQEPYQDDDPEMSDSYEMSTPFETNQSKKKHRVEFDYEPYSNFAYFMDGTRKTYKIGDIVINKKKIFPVVAAQTRAGCTFRDETGKIHKYTLKEKNLLLVSDVMPDDDFDDLRLRIQRSQLAKEMHLDVVTYKYDRMKDLAPTNAAIAKANSLMHRLEIEILMEMANSKALDTGKMLIVDGPLQFYAEDNIKADFADLFYNVVGVSKSFNPLLPISDRVRGGAQIGAMLISLEFGERTPVFFKRNERGRVFGCWYLRIRRKSDVRSPMEGIIKVEKMANEDDLAREGLDSVVVDNLSRSLLSEGSPTCHGRDDRWPAHLYPVYLTETMVKTSFMSDENFISNFKRDFH